MPISVDELRDTVGPSGYSPRQLEELRQRFEDESLPDAERVAAGQAYAQATRANWTALSQQLSGALDAQLVRWREVVANLANAAMPDMFSFLAALAIPPRPFPSPLLQPQPVTTRNDGQEHAEWEYCRIALKEGNGGYYVHTVSPNLEQDARIMGTNMDLVLTTLGNDRWELSTTLSTNTTTYLLFKRRKP